MQILDVVREFPATVRGIKYENFGELYRALQQDEKGWLYNALLQMALAGGWSTENEVAEYREACLT